MRYFPVVLSAILSFNHFCSAKPAKQHTSGQNAVNVSKTSADAGKSTLRGLSLLPQLSAEIQTIFEKNKNAVVKVMSAQSGTDAPILYGTGFFIDSLGRVLTTATIAPAGNNLWVELNDISYSAQLLGTDPVTNLAVIELTRQPVQFQAIDLGKFDAYSSSAIGEFVIAIGSTLGMSPSPRLGTITGNDLTYGDHVFAATYLRSDLEIYGGESGSPVFDSAGNLCGILIASLPEIHSSFIIPRCMLARIAESLKNKQPVIYASGGFNVQGQVSSIGAKEIAISSAPASIPGQEKLQKGDILVSIDGKPIRSERDIANLLFFKHPDTEISITVRRAQNTSNGKPQTEQKTISQKLKPKQ